MTPPQKPEWMELADADSVPVIKKKTRLIPALIASVALAIVGVGAIAAQISDEAPASAIEKVAPVATTATPVPVTSKASPVIPKQPSIAALPNSGRGKDDEHESEDD